MLYFERILNIGIALSQETNYQRLLDYILEEAMSITKADAGSLYMCKDMYLEFKVVRNNSLETPVNTAHNVLPPVPKNESNVCAYAAIHNQVINIEDVYESTEFEFTGPKQYDELINYRTQSMLVVPLSNNQNQVIGVIQLINSKEEGEIVSFKESDIKIVTFLASQSAITLTNEKHAEEMKKILYSFVEVLSTVIDERTPYNANHTRNLVNNTKKVIKYINKNYGQMHQGRYISANNEEQILISAWLHDIGKIITPIEVMNKATRLEGKIEGIHNRLAYIKSMARIHQLEAKISNEVFEKLNQEIEKVKQHVDACNRQGELTVEQMDYTRQISAYEYTNLEGDSCMWLTAEEVENLLIENGTLTEKERDIMKEHVSLTGKLLSKMNFETLFKDVPYLAQSHHECLDGTGYPRGLEAQELTFEARLLGVMDIYEALTSSDRPYRGAMKVGEVLNILENLVNHGKLDGEIVSILKEMHQNEKL